MASRLLLRIGTRVFTGWKEVSISKSITAASGSFAVTVAEKIPFPISPGDSVVIEFGQSKILTGYIDSVKIGFTSKDHTYGITGRDRTADLVDCSAANIPGQFVGLTAGQIANKLAGPLGVAVVSPIEGRAVFPSFDLQPGETAWEAIERACRMRQFLAFSDEFGSLMISPPGAMRAGVVLREGLNILEGESEQNHSERFSNYLVRGQSPGSDSWNGEDAAGAEGSVTDAGIIRYRPLIVVSESATDSVVAFERAKWEATVRAARGSRVKVKVQGWEEKEGGTLWRPNRLVTVVSRSMAVNSDFLIAGVNYNRGAAGTTATLDLVRPDAFIPEPVVPAEDFVGDGWGDEDA